MSPEHESGEATTGDEIATVERNEFTAHPRRVPVNDSIESDPPEKRPEAGGSAIYLATRTESKHAEELAELDRKAAGWELAYRSAVRDREMATALAGLPLVPGAAAQLIKLWRDDFDVYMEYGEVRVASRDGLTVSRAITERLASPEYAHFSLPSSRGGASASDRDPYRVAPVGVSIPVVRTLGEAIVRQWREAQRHPKSRDASIGLNRRR